MVFHYQQPRSRPSLTSSPVIPEEVLEVIPEVVAAADHRPAIQTVKTVCCTRREIITLTRMVVPLVMAQLYKAELGHPASLAIVSSGMKANRVEAIAAVL